MIFNGYGPGMGKMGEGMGTGIDIGLITLNPLYSYLFFNMLKLFSI